MKNTNTHLLDVWHLIGTEYMAWGVDTFTPEFFIEYWESNFEKLYNQLEWKDKYGSTLCTIYWPITALSIVLGREVTSEERLELVEARIAMYDFNKAVGGWTSIWVDVCRRWYNRKFPNDPIVSQLVNDKKLIEKLSQKSIPLVTSLRATRNFTIDTRDWVLNNFDSWATGSKYWHCRTRKQLKILDNYNNSYSYQSLSDLERSMSMAFESRNCYMFIKESMLSEKGKSYLKYMKGGFWNGERAEDNITRFEASRIALRLDSTLKEKSVWNEKNGWIDATRFEISIMLGKGNKQIPTYTGTDRNQPMTRGETIEYLAKYS